LEDAGNGNSAPPSARRATGASALQDSQTNGKAADDRSHGRTLPLRETRPRPDTALSTARPPVLRPAAEPTAPFTPDFFIVGAPKCGTTALASVLSRHPDVRFCRYKEPHFFCTDLNWQIVKTERDYAALFDLGDDPASARAKLCGEASVFYLLSRTAIPAIEARGSAPRYIVLLRQPAKLIRSLYLENRKAGDEQHRSLAAAWHASLSHDASAHRNPAAMRYADVGRLGEQLERLYATVPRERVHVIFHEDLLRAPLQVYADTLQFLGLPHDGRERFPIENESRDYHSSRYNRGITLISDLLGPHFRYRTSLRHVARALRFFNQKVVPVTDTDDAAIDTVITEYFAPDIRRLGRLLDRNVDDWLVA